MEYVNVSHPCFSQLDNRTMEISLSLLQLGMNWASPSFLVMSFIAIPLNVLSIIVVVKTVSNPHGSRNGAIGEGPIHFVLLAISDIFVVSSPWIIHISFYFGRARNFCNMNDLRHFSNTWLCIVVTTNRWITFYMAVQRCRVFSFNYGLNQLRNSTRTNLKRSIIYGLICGLAQGILISTAVGMIINSFPKLIAAPTIASSIHPAIVMPAMIYVTITMIVKLKINDAAAPHSTGSQPIYREFQISTITVCLFYVLSQVANFAFIVTRVIDNEGQHVAHYVYALMTYINSTVNFFLYLGTSRRFRAALQCIYNQSAVKYGRASQNLCEPAVTSVSSGVLSSEMLEAIKRFPLLLPNALLDAMLPLPLPPPSS